MSYYDEDDMRLYDLGNNISNVDERTLKSNRVKQKELELKQKAIQKESAQVGVNSTPTNVIDTRVLSTTASNVALEYSKHRRDVEELYSKENEELAKRKLFLNAMMNDVATRNNPYLNHNYSDFVGSNFHKNFGSVEAMLRYQEDLTQKSIKAQEFENRRENQLNRLRFNENDLNKAIDNFEYEKQALARGLVREDRQREQKAIWESLSDPFLPDENTNLANFTLGANIRSMLTNTAGNLSGGIGDKFAGAEGVYEGIKGALRGEGYQNAFNRYVEEIEENPDKVNGVANFFRNMGNSITEYSRSQNAVSPYTYKAFKSILTDKDAGLMDKVTGGLSFAGGVTAESLIGNAGEIALASSPVGLALLMSTKMHEWDQDKRRAEGRATGGFGLKGIDPYTMVAAGTYAGFQKITGGILHGVSSKIVDGISKGASKLLGRSVANGETKGIGKRVVDFMVKKGIKAGGVVTTGATLEGVEEYVQTLAELLAKSDHKNMKDLFEYAKSYNVQKQSKEAGILGAVSGGTLAGGVHIAKGIKDNITNRAEQRSRNQLIEESNSENRGSDYYREISNRSFTEAELEANPTLREDIEAVNRYKEDPDRFVEEEIDKIESIRNDDNLSNEEKSSEINKIETRLDNIVNSDLDSRAKAVENTKYDNYMRNASENKEISSSGRVGSYQANLRDSITIDEAIGDDFNNFANAITNSKINPKVKNYLNSYLSMVNQSKSFTQAFKDNYKAKSFTEVDDRIKATSSMNKLMKYLAIRYKHYKDKGELNKFNVPKLIEDYSKYKDKSKEEKQKENREFLTPSQRNRANAVNNKVLDDTEVEIKDNDSITTDESTSMKEEENTKESIRQRVKRRVKEEIKEFGNRLKSGAKSTASAVAGVSKFTTKRVLKELNTLVDTLNTKDKFSLEEYEEPVKEFIKSLDIPKSQLRAMSESSDISKELQTVFNKILEDTDSLDNNEESTVVSKPVSERAVYTTDENDNIYNANFKGDSGTARAKSIVAHFQGEEKGNNGFIEDRRYHQALLHLAEQRKDSSNYLDEPYSQFRYLANKITENGKLDNALEQGIFEDYMSSPIFPALTNMYFDSLSNIKKFEDEGTTSHSQVSKSQPGKSSALDNAKEKMKNYVDSLSNTKSKAFGLSLYINKLRNSNIPSSSTVISNFAENVSKNFAKLHQAVINYDNKTVGKRALANILKHNLEYFNNWLKSTEDKIKYFNIAKEYMKERNISSPYLLYRFKRDGNRNIEYYDLDESNETNSKALKDAYNKVVGMNRNNPDMAKVINDLNKGDSNYYYGYVGNVDSNFDKNTYINELEEHSKLLNDGANVLNEILKATRVNLNENLVNRSNRVLNAIKQIRQDSIKRNIKEVYNTAKNTYFNIKEDIEKTQEKIDNLTSKSHLDEDEIKELVETRDKIVDIEKELKVFINDFKDILAFYSNSPNEDISESAKALSEMLKVLDSVNDIKKAEELKTLNFKTRNSNNIVLKAFYNIANGIKLLFNSLVKLKQSLIHNVKRLISKNKDIKDILKDEGLIDNNEEIILKISKKKKSVTVEIDDKLASALIFANAVVRSSNNENVVVDNELKEIYDNPKITKDPHSFINLFDINQGKSRANIFLQYENKGLEKNVEEFTNSKVNFNSYSFKTFYNSLIELKNTNNLEYFKDLYDENGKLRLRYAKALYLAYLDTMANRTISSSLGIKDKSIIGGMLERNRNRVENKDGRASLGNRLSRAFLSILGVEVNKVVPQAVANSLKEILGGQLVDLLLESFPNSRSTPFKINNKTYKIEFKESDSMYNPNNLSKEEFGKTFQNDLKKYQEHLAELGIVKGLKASSIGLSAIKSLKGLKSGSFKRTPSALTQTTLDYLNQTKFNVYKENIAIVRNLFDKLENIEYIKDFLTEGNSYAPISKYIGDYILLASDSTTNLFEEYENYLKDKGITNTTEYLDKLKEVLNYTSVDELQKERNFDKNTLESIKDHTARLTGLISNLLEVAKISKEEEEGMYFSFHQLPNNRIGINGIYNNPHSNKFFRDIIDLSSSNREKIEQSEIDKATTMFLKDDNKILLRYLTHNLDFKNLSSLKEEDADKHNEDTIKLLKIIKEEKENLGNNPSLEDISIASFKALRRAREEGLEELSGTKLISLFRAIKGFKNDLVDDLDITLLPASENDARTSVAGNMGILAPFNNQLLKLAQASGILNITTLDVDYNDNYERFGKTFIKRVLDIEYAKDKKYENKEDFLYDLEGYLINAYDSELGLLNFYLVKDLLDKVEFTKGSTFSEIRDKIMSQKLRNYGKIPLQVDIYGSGLTNNTANMYTSMLYPTFIRISQKLQRFYNDTDIKENIENYYKTVLEDNTNMSSIAVRNAFDIKDFFSDPNKINNVLSKEEKEELERVTKDNKLKVKDYADDYVNSLIKDIKFFKLFTQAHTLDDALDIYKDDGKQYEIMKQYIGKIAGRLVNDSLNEILVGEKPTLSKVRDLYKVAVTLFMDRVATELANINGNPKESNIKLSIDSNNELVIPIENVSEENLNKAFKIVSNLKEYKSLIAPVLSNNDENAIMDFLSQAVQDTYSDIAITETPVDSTDVNDERRKQHRSFKINLTTLGNTFLTNIGHTTDGIITSMITLSSDDMTTFPIFDANMLSAIDSKKGEELLNNATAMFIANKSFNLVMQYLDNRKDIQKLYDSISNNTELKSLINNIISQDSVEELFDTARVTSEISDMYRKLLEATGFNISAYSSNVFNENGTISGKVEYPADNSLDVSEIQKVFNSFDAQAKFLLNTLGKNAVINKNNIDKAINVSNQLLTNINNILNDSGINKVVKSKLAELLGFKDTSHRISTFKQLPQNAETKEILSHLSSDENIHLMNTINNLIQYTDSINYDSEINLRGTIFDGTSLESNLEKKVRNILFNNISESTILSNQRPAVIRTLTKAIYENYMKIVNDDSIKKKPDHLDGALNIYDKQTKSASNIESSLLRTIVIDESLLTQTVDTNDEIFKSKQFIELQKELDSTGNLGKILLKFIKAKNIVTNLDEVVGLYTLLKNEDIKSKVKSFIRAYNSSNFTNNLWNIMKFIGVLAKDTDRNSSSKLETELDSFINYMSKMTKFTVYPRDGINNAISVRDTSNTTSVRKPFQLAMPTRAKAILTTILKPTKQLIEVARKSNPDKPLSKDMLIEAGKSLSKSDNISEEDMKKVSKLLNDIEISEDMIKMIESNDDLSGIEDNDLIRLEADLPLDKVAKMFEEFSKDEPSSEYVTKLTRDDLVSKSQPNANNTHQIDRASEEIVRELSRVSNIDLANNPNEINNIVEELLKYDRNRSDVRVSESDARFYKKQLDTFFNRKDGMKFLRDNITLDVKTTTEGLQGSYTLKADRSSSKVSLMFSSHSENRMSSTEIFLHELNHSFIDFLEATGVHPELLIRLDEIKKEWIAWASSNVKDLASRLGVDEDTFKKYYLDYMKTPKEFFSIMQSNRILQESLIEVPTKKKSLLQHFLELARSIIDIVFGTDFSIKDKSYAYQFAKLSINIAKASNNLLDVYKNEKQLEGIRKLLDIVDNFTGKPLERFSQIHTDNLNRAFNNLLSKKSTSTASKLTGAVLIARALLHLARNEPLLHQNVMRTLREVMGVNPGGVFTQLYSSMSLNDGGKRMISILKGHSDNIDRTRNNIEISIKSELSNFFKNTPLSKQEEVNLAYTIKKLDLSVLKEDVDYIANLFNNREFLQSEIDKSIKDIARLVDDKESLDFYKTQSSNLGYYLAKGERLGYTLENPIAIALKLTPRSEGVRDINKAIDNDIRALANKIDVLTTLYAINYSDSAKTNVFSSLAKRNKSGLENLLKYSNEITNMSRKHFNNSYEANTLNYQKGFTKYSENKSVDIKLGTSADINEMRKLGYHVIKVYGSDLTKDNLFSDVVLFANKTVLPQAYNRGVFRTINNGSRGWSLGSLIKSKNPNIGEKELEAMTYSTINNIGARLDYRNKHIWIDNGITPMWDKKGRLKDFKIVLDNSVKEQLGMNSTSIYDAISNEAVRIIDNELSNDANKMYVDKMMKYYEQNKDDKAIEWITLGANIDYNKNKDYKRYQDFWNMLSFETKKYIQNYGGANGNGVLHLRADTITTLIGHKDLRLTETDRFNNSQINGVAKRIAKLVEGVAIKIGGWNKERIVIKTPEVLKDNTLSNIAVVGMFNISPKQYLIDSVEFIQQYDKYMDIRKKIDSLELKKRVAKDTNIRNKIDNKVDEYNKALEKQYPLVFKMDKLGMISNIVEDIDFMDKEASKDFIDKGISNMLGRLPKSQQELIKFLYVTEDTTLHKFMSKATLLSDATARYTMLKRMGTTMSDEDLLDLTQKAFINYAISDHPIIKYMNDIGLLMFSKYFLRIPAFVTGHMLSKKLGRTTMLEVLSNLLAVGLSTPIDSVVPMKLLRNVPIFHMPLVHQTDDMISNLLPILNFIPNYK